MNSVQYRKTIFSLAWPIFVEQLLISLVQAADSAMVGSLGAVSTAAVAINYPATMLINGIIMAFGIGFTALIAQSIGAQDPDRAERLTLQAILLIIATGLGMSVLVFLLARKIPFWLGGGQEILDEAEIYNRILALSLTFRGLTMVLTAINRGYGDSRTPMKINVFVNVLNVTGNFFMIYPTRTVSVLKMELTVAGCGWGVAGAAVSTCLSEIIGGTALLIMALSGRGAIRIHGLRGKRMTWQDLPEVLKISFPAMLERFTMSTAFLVVGRAVASLGTAAIAAQNLAGAAESISFMPGFAFGNAITTLFGQSVGAGEDEKAHCYVVESIRMGSAVMAVMSVLMFVFSTSVMGIFTRDPEVIVMGSVIMKLSALIQIPQMIASVYSGALKGAGDAHSSFIIALISMWGIRLAGTVICVHVFHMGIAEANICICVDCTVRCLLYHLRYRQGLWRKENRQPVKA